MNKIELTTGTEIFNHGDICNEAKFGIIAAVLKDSWGTHLDVIYDDGTTSRLEACGFADKYLGNGSTRLVTKAAYEEWRQAEIARYFAK